MSEKRKSNKKPNIEKKKLHSTIYRACAITRYILLKNYIKQHRGLDKFFRPASININDIKT